MLPPARISRMAIRLLWVWFLAAAAFAADVVTTPFRGITHIDRTETAPRELRIHLVKIDLTARGVRFKLTPPSGSRETVRQTTLEFLDQERAQIAINAHFFVPYPSEDRESWLVGFAASEGKVYSTFERPAQSYALVANAPAIAIDRENRVSLVVDDRATAWTAVSGSAQIVTAGVKTIPRYATGELTPGGPGAYSDTKSWYDAVNARTAIGLSRDRRTLWLFTVDAREGSRGMSVGEVADMLIREGVHDALNLDGGGSTTLAMEDPQGTRRIVNAPTGAPPGRSVASNLAVFAPRID
jgi:exopolysaccharide biosynthesis protein